MRRSASLAACLLGAAAIASCTSDGLTPPADIGSGAAQPVQASLAPQPADNVTMAPAGAPMMAASAAQPPASPPTMTQAAAPAFAAPEPASAAPVSAVISGSRIQFAPITGTTREAAVPLSQELAVRAQQRGIALAGNGAQPTHILKGYFSQLSGNGATTVTYVWDVVDVSGNRLHRIQGQAQAAGEGGWAVVPPATMQGIADRTIDDLARWLAARAG